MGTVSKMLYSRVTLVLAFSTAQASFNTRNPMVRTTLITPWVCKSKLYDLIFCSSRYGLIEDLTRASTGDAN